MDGTALVRELTATMQDVQACMPYLAPLHSQLRIWQVVAVAEGLALALVAVVLFLRSQTTVK